MDMFDISGFANQKFLWLAVMLIPLAGLYIYRAVKGGATIRISSVSGLKKGPKTLKYYLRHLPVALVLIGMLALVVALARPQRLENMVSSTTEGIDIMMSIDISGSMLARDFTPDRMTAAKYTAAQFITDRVNDRIGIVVFAGESFTQCPLTTDKRTLLNLLSGVRSGMIEDGTAIGSGLATAVNRLKESKAESKIIILLTDGVNNRGQISPITAAEIAKTYGIRVYTVGIGTIGTAPMPAVDIWGRTMFVNAKVEIDEDILKQISELTGGEYFRATDNNTLEQVYEKINALERSKIETTEYVKYTELYSRYIISGLIMICLAFIISRFWLRQLP